MGQTGSNQEMNASHQAWALEKTPDHRKAARASQSVPAGQAVYRSKQVKPNSPLRGLTTGVLDKDSALLHILIL
jgi:hypothetical protein